MKDKSQPSAEGLLSTHRVAGLHVLAAEPSGAAEPAADAVSGAATEPEVAAEHPSAAPLTSSPRPPLLLIHGATHGAWCWERWLPALAARGWPAYALSLRNHPGSFAVDDATYRTGLTLAHYLEDVVAVAEWMAARWPGRACVPVGHSLGGILAQLLAEREARRGEPVSALILLASVPPRPLGPLRERPVPLSKAYLPAAARPGAPLPADPVQAGILRRMAPESPSVMNEYSLGPGVPVERALVTCPLLVVSAELDNTIVPHDRRIADHYGADYLLAERIGHALMLEDGWEPLLERILAWLEGKV